MVHHKGLHPIHIAAAYKCSTASMVGGLVDAAGQTTLSCKVPCLRCADELAKSQHAKPWSPHPSVLSALQPRSSPTDTTSPSCAEQTRECTCLKTRGSRQALPIIPPVYGPRARLGSLPDSEGVILSGEGLGFKPKLLLVTVALDTVMGKDGAAIMPIPWMALFDWHLQPFTLRCHGNIAIAYQNVYCRATCPHPNAPGPAVKLDATPATCIPTCAPIISIQCMSYQRARQAERHLTN
jgi:hypothetical protein